MDLASAPTGDRRPWSPNWREINPLQSSNPEPHSYPGEVDLFANLSADEIAAFDRPAPARTFRNREIVISRIRPVTAPRLLIARASGTIVRLAGSQNGTRLGHVTLRLTRDQLVTTRESSKTMAGPASRGLLRQARGRTDLDGLAILSNRMA